MSAFSVAFLPVGSPIVSTIAAELRSNWMGVLVGVNAKPLSEVGDPGLISPFFSSAHSTVLRENGSLITLIGFQ